MLLDSPTIGCAKSRLIGEHRDPGLRAGCHVTLADKGEEIGRVLRTRDGCKPIYVSVGHRISLERAVEVVMCSMDRYRVPKPTREADLYVAHLKSVL